MSSVARVLEFIDSQGIKKSEFYLKTHFSNGYLDKVKELGADKIESIISAYPEINLTWLITGKGDMIAKKESNTPPEYGGFDMNSTFFMQLALAIKRVDASQNASPTASPTAENDKKTGYYTIKNSPDQGLYANDPGSRYGADDERDKISIELGKIKAFLRSKYPDFDPK